MNKEKTFEEIKREIDKECNKKWDMYFYEGYEKYKNDYKASKYADNKVRKDKDELAKVRYNLSNFTARFVMELDCRPQ